MIWTSSEEWSAHPIPHLNILHIFIFSKNFILRTLEYLQESYFDFQISEFSFDPRFFPYFLKFESQNVTLADTLFRNKFDQIE